MDIIAEEKKLKPCPFCGGKAGIGHMEMSPRYLVFCKNCGAKVFNPTVISVIEKWNYRINERK